MINVAVVTAENQKANKLFSPEFGRDNSLERFRILQSILHEQGCNCLTADMFIPCDIDVIIFHDLQGEFEAILRVIKANPEVRLIYIPNEPPIISPMHHETILPKLAVDAVLTWNDNIAGKYPHIFKCNIGQPCIATNTISSISFAEKKLLACIYSNKSSPAQNSLYSERLKAIEFFNRTPSGMDLYGMGWETSKLPYIQASYRGACESKKNILQSYKFSIAFENVEGLPGLITEKLFDCFAAGTVPIYYGAPNIHDYIPSTCFIDFRRFRDYEELYQYLTNMPEDEYMGYLAAAKDFILTPEYTEFTSKRYAEIVTTQIQKLISANPPIRSIFQVKCQLIKIIALNPSHFLKKMSSFRRLMFNLLTVW